jgi:hypothetical protein
MEEKKIREHAALIIVAVVLSLLLYGVGTGTIDSKVVVDMLKPVMEWAGM